jgi:hypothetical protein
MNGFTETVQGVLTTHHNLVRSASKYWKHLYTVDGMALA